MHDIPEPEARMLLCQPLICQDAGDWKNVGQRLHTRILQNGLVDENGTATGLYVELRFHRRPRSGGTSYTLSVFRRNRIDAERVYQLSVVQVPKPMKDIHGKSHEHFGASRYDGAEKWQEWSYDEVLEYFSTVTNIAFDPVPAHPT
jgi:hypothetical protein